VQTPDIYVLRRRDMPDSCWLALTPVSFRHHLILPDVCAVGVVSLTDAVGLKYIGAPLSLVLVFEGILVGSLLHMEQLAFNPFDRRLQGKRNSANKE
jgi:hypothetical protein